jgi:hypothetical protein
MKHPIWRIANHSAPTPLRSRAWDVGWTGTLEKQQLRTLAAALLQVFRASRRRSGTNPEWSLKPGLVGFLLVFRRMAVSFNPNTIVEARAAI